MMRLWVDDHRLSRPFSTAPASTLAWAVTVGVILMLVSAPAVRAHSHSASKVRFVDYSPAAFEAAQREGKPVFLLISAVWCYWCKYFDRNTIESEEVATYLNRNYLSIFVDHDRRADVVRRYARGLPMIVLFEPAGHVRQSFAGALKKEDFLDVLKRVATDVRTQAGAGPPRNPRIDLRLAPPVPVTREAYRQLRKGMLDLVSDRLDRVHGGFGTGDKYPHPRLLRYLIAQYGITRDRRYLAAVTGSLDGILKGIYDPVEGGFFRYAEGREWRQPHYEKLLPVNVALAQAFAEAHSVTQNPRYRDAAEATIVYLRRTLYDANDGGFYGSQTAEPAYYRLTSSQRPLAAKPPINRDRVTAWNAEAALTFFGLGQSMGRKDLIDVGHRTLDFMRRNLISEKGAFQLYDVETGRGVLLGQLEANAWAALAFLEGYRVARKEDYRRAIELVLGYAKVELFDAAQGVFVDDREVPVSLGSNGIMAEALIRAHRLTGRTDDLDIASRVLAAMGGAARALLVEGDDAAVLANVSDAVPYLTAYRSIVGP